MGRAILLAFFKVLISVLTPTVGHTATWLAAVDSLAQPKNPAGAAFGQLFANGAGWNDAASKTQIFKVSTQFLHGASDREVSAVIRFLRAHHIALAMEGLLLISSGRCGGGIESYSGPGVIQGIADRVKRLGGEIDYVAMDEPLRFGNERQGRGLCHDSVEDLARQMVPSVRSLQTAFPRAQFGDIEPLAERTVGRINLMLRFAQAFRVASGSSISFVHADVVWRDNWRPQLTEWKIKLHRAGIKFGVIFDGDPADTTDKIWIDHAAERYRAVSSETTMRPDDTIFQLWQPRPERLLPDSDPTTLTGLVKAAV